ncbi:hypothetical protein CBR_g36828 [Chara braunii]|uniref:Secreted protein n=1 Tax=Chara braunii TaxID=69332 RepID=A0A388LLN7_CHABU|nr:hypothetical protein CBR_g36828 [Chara braunii]|eukprot:GBG83214.1 hypothetical protein CBR_g36828 [Chara braunii]
MVHRTDGMFFHVVHRVLLTWSVCHLVHTAWPVLMCSVPRGPALSCSKVSVVLNVPCNWSSLRPLTDVERAGGVFVRVPYGEDEPKPERQRRDVVAFFLL